jgi:hypothetical protein
MTKETKLMLLQLIMQRLDALEQDNYISSEKKEVEKISLILARQEIVNNLVISAS